MLRKSLIYLLLILVMGFFLRFWGLGNTDFSADEGGYAYDAFEYWKGNPGVVPRYHPRNHGHENIGHPFVVQHLLSFSYKLFGPSILSSRMISCLASLITIILIYLIASKMFNLSTACLAAALFSLFPLVVYWSRTIHLDSVFTLAIALFTLAYIFFEKTRSYFSTIILGFISGLILLIKLDGPLIILFLFLQSLFLKKIKISLKLFKTYLILILVTAVIFIVGVSPRAYLEGIIYPSDTNFTFSNIYQSIFFIWEMFFSYWFQIWIPLPFILLVILGLRKYLLNKMPIWLPLLFLCWLPLILIHVTGKSGFYGLMPIIFFGCLFAAFYINSYQVKIRKVIVFTILSWFIYSSVRWGLMESLRLKQIDSIALQYLMDLKIDWKDKIYLYERPHSYFFAEQKLNFIVDPALVKESFNLLTYSYIVSTDLTPEGKALNQHILGHGFNLIKTFANQERNLLIFTKLK